MLLPTEMFLLLKLDAAGQLAAGATSKNISVANNTNFNAYVDVFFYTPCSASLANQNAFAGQEMATNLTMANNFEMNYRPVLVPGAGEITGFKQDIAYVREDS